MFVEVKWELQDTKYQSFSPSSFRKQEFFKFSFFFSPIFQFVTSRMAPVLTPGASYEQTW